MKAFRCEIKINVAEATDPDPTRIWTGIQIHIGPPPLVEGRVHGYLLDGYSELDAHGLIKCCTQVK